MESSETAFFRLDCLVPGFRPKCISKEAFFVSAYMVNQGTYYALFKLSRRFCISSRFTFIRFSSDWMVLSIPVCKFGMPFSRIILYLLQKLLYYFEIKALPLSDLVFFRYAVYVYIFPEECYNSIVVCIFTNFSYQPAAILVDGN